MKKLTTAALLMIVLVTACSKKDKTTSRSELLTSGTWKLTAAEEDADGNGTYETDNYVFFLDCFKDNYTSFSTNGQLEMNEGPTKCSPGDPQSETSTWQLTNNDATLVVGGDSYEILELNNSTLRLKLALSGGRSHRTTFSKR
jgi:hypothetical protein